VTVPSQYLKDRIPAVAQAEVIPNAVNLEEFTPVRLVERETLQLTIVTNFWFPEKVRGVVHLLELLAPVAADNSLPKFSLHVVGGGGYLETVKNQAAQAPFPVTFHGWIDPRKVFSNTDAFLYYSYHDNMPNAVLEAMAAGLPVITNRVGAIPEMIETNTSGIIAASDEDYVSAMKRVLGSFAWRQELGRKSRQRIERQFSWERVVGRYLDLYRRG
jgi:glycosyltransferase involved in cell wall biosynthesis